MSYKYIQTPKSKSLIKVRHDHADKNTISEKIKDRAGKIYAKMVDGSIRRLDPLKPWRGKSERRQVLQDRRTDRLLKQTARDLALAS